jgi:TRAP-type C4-dicarboxylate transport system permease small subunit
MNAAPQNRGAANRLGRGILRRFLDGLYNTSGAVAAGLTAMICILVTAQVVLNIITKIGGASVAMTIPSYADFAGYFLAASSFLALAYTFTRGGHIRVTLVLGAMTSPKLRLTAEIAALVICSATSVFATYYMTLLLEESYRFGDKSTGIVSISTWIPQTSVVVGLAIFSVALIDVLVQVIRNRAPIIEYHEKL